MRHPFRPASWPHKITFVNLHRRKIYKEIKISIFIKSMELNKMETKQKQYKYEEVYLYRYQSDEAFKKEHIVYDEYETEELLGEEQAKKIAKIYYAKANILEEDGVNVTRISVNTLDLDNELKALQAEILEISKTVSGDDDYYDYFPDKVNAFCQVCEHFKKVAFYNETVKILNKTREDEPFYEI